MVSGVLSSSDPATARSRASHSAGGGGVGLAQLAIVAPRSERSPSGRGPRASWYDQQPDIAHIAATASTLITRCDIVGLGSFEVVHRWRSIRAMGLTSKKCQAYRMNGREVNGRCAKICHGFIRFAVAFGRRRQARGDVPRALVGCCDQAIRTSSERD